METPCLDAFAGCQTSRRPPGLQALNGCACSLMGVMPPAKLSRLVSKARRGSGFDSGCPMPQALI